MAACLGSFGFLGDQRSKQSEDWAARFVAFLKDEASFGYVGQRIASFRLYLLGTFHADGVGSKPEDVC